MTEDEINEEFLSTINNSWYSRLNHTILETLFFEYIISQILGYK